MDIKPFVMIVAILIGWSLTIRAGIRIHRWALSGRVPDRRVAIGNTIVSVIPLAVAAVLGWPA